MPRWRILEIVGIVLLLGAAVLGQAIYRSHGRSADATRCAALESADLTNVRDAPTHVMSAVLMQAANMPAFCRVRGYIDRNIGIEMRLPVAGWNGKLLEIGCGGFCGSTTFIVLCNGPLRRGYACIISDTGHRSTMEEASWAKDDLEARMDWGERAAHVAALAGKALVADFYGVNPRKSYFIGCSTGGHQAMMEAERFPLDFNGIVAGAPPVNFSENTMASLWTAKAVLGGGGGIPLDRGDLQLVHDAVLARCDRDDGVADRVVGNPAACGFNPAVLLCRAGAQAKCLTSEKMAAVNRVYGGPANSAGQKLYLGGALPGSELNWEEGGADARFSYEYFRYMAFAPAFGDGASGPRSGFKRFGLGDTLEAGLRHVFSHAGPAPVPKPAEIDSVFDFDRDYVRLGAMNAFYSAADPDLRRFKNAGGKLIAYQGWQDVSGVPEDIIDYYDLVEKTMGGRASTQSFFRLFMIPGMNHCTWGEGAFAVDYLGYLEAWEERGEAPDRIIGSHAENVNWYQAFTLEFPLPAGTPVRFTRPIFPYPERAVYKGSGDPSLAANFVPAAP